MKALVEEMFILEDMLSVSLAIEMEHYIPSDSALRTIIIFKTDKDERRIPLPNTTTKVIEGQSAIVYGSYAYNIKKLFWDVEWDQFSMEVEIDYNNETYANIPMELTQKIQFVEQASDSSITIHCGHYSNICRGDYSIPHILIIFILRCLNYLLGILSFPLFLLVGIFAFLPGYDEERNLGGKSAGSRLLRYVGRRFFRYCGLMNGVEGFQEDIIRMIYHLASSFFFRKKGILIISNRRKDLTGNFQYVYEKLKDQDVTIDLWLKGKDPMECHVGEWVSFAFKAAKAKIILVDDYIPVLAAMKLSKKTKVLQLWHACGSFKTFGFSRLGRKGAPNQFDEAHRIYSGVFVSSSQICKNYSEGFGIAPSKVHPYGVPRTDVFFDKSYASDIRSRLYDRYPKLKDKKVVLFAPTFRGNGKNSSYYEKDAFSPEKLIKRLPDDYIVIIKHHPFVKIKYSISEEYKERVFDFSAESEINDLLFITDILVTDYSSVIYEASILDIPMLFYAYDQEAYLASRDFYSGYQDFVPGKIVRNQDDLAEAIINNDFEHEKVALFCRENFDELDGKSSVRIADYILNINN